MQAGTFSDPTSYRHGNMVIVNVAREHACYKLDPRGSRSLPGCAVGMFTLQRGCGGMVRVQVDVGEGG